MPLMYTWTYICSTAPMHTASLAAKLALQIYQVALACVHCMLPPCSSCLVMLLSDHAALHVHPAYPQAFLGLLADHCG